MPRKTPPLPPIERHGSATHPLGMPCGDFLREYWQKHPLLIRAAFPDFKLPLQADELAGLACEDGVLARVVLHDSQADSWTVRHGPFEESMFAQLPSRDWTLLVQDVDKWDMDVAALLDAFDFLPSWRIDDIMVSYAEDGGSVGAHVDQYDVFLLQGLGYRRWRISTDPDAPREHRDDAEIRLLRHFQPTHEWLLEPGDMLYLPPGVPHEGVAEGACMTFSIGMRAPAESGLLTDLAEHVAEALPEHRRYRDAELTPAQRPGEIDDDALDRVAAAVGPLVQALQRQALGDWFGCFITRYRSAQLPAPPRDVISSDQLRQALDAGTALMRHPFTRLAWRARDAEQATLYAAGSRHTCSIALATALCAQRMLASASIPDARADLRVLLALVNDGHLLLHEADDDD